MSRQGAARRPLRGVSAVGRPLRRLLSGGFSEVQRYYVETLDNIRPSFPEVAGVAFKQLHQTAERQASAPVRPDLGGCHAQNENPVLRRLRTQITPDQLVLECRAPLVDGARAVQLDLDARGEDAGGVHRDIGMLARSDLLLANGIVLAHAAPAQLGGDPALKPTLGDLRTCEHPAVAEGMLPEKT